MKNPNLNKPIAKRPFKKEYRFVETEVTGNSDKRGNNTTGTTVTLELHIKDSLLLSDEEKETVLNKLKRRINEEGFLQVSAGEYKSQAQNKQLAEKRFYSYLTNVIKRKNKEFQQNMLKEKLGKKNLLKRKPSSNQSGRRKKKLSEQKVRYKKTL